MTNIWTGIKNSYRMPMIYQAEASECGLACLAMVSNFHGHRIDLNGIRRRFNVGLNGLNLSTMIDLCQQLGLSARALRLELHHLGELKMPAILHWELNHFVVLKSVKGKKFTVLDPNLGEIEYGIEAFSEKFTGVALEIVKPQNFNIIFDKSKIGLKNLASGFEGLYKSFVYILFVSLSLQLLVLAAPFQVQIVIDEAIGRSDDSLLIVVAAGFFILAILLAVISGLREWSIRLLGFQLVYQIVGNLMQHVMKLPIGFFEKRHMGDILSRFGSTKTIQQVLTQGIASVLIDGTMALVSASILIFYSMKLSAIVFAGLFLIGAINWAFYPIIRDRSEAQIANSANEQTYLMETLRAISPIKIMGFESVREANWRNLFSLVFDSAAKSARVEIFLNSIVMAANGIQTVAILYFGAKSILNNEGLSVGMLVAFLAFRQIFVDRSLALVQQFTQFRLISLHMDRLSDLVHATSEDMGGQEDLRAVEGDIELQNLSYRYGDADRWVFKDATLKIQAGEYIAITGPSGGGKSTLVKLMLGLMPPNEGTIKLDGHEATPARWRSWRASVGYVAQNDNLLSGTIAENISFFSSDFDTATIHEAAKIAQIHNEILKMPMGYHTLVGDMGSSLSGGQKQRLLLARALYRKPKILILDEGTANIDEETEEIISQIIRELDITRIAVAHRPSLIKKADRIVDVYGAKITEVNSYVISDGIDLKSFEISR
ncbi:peptidase domain-containing ABC transporter [Asticcacaulis excentricus]|nr:peptidase domain-containing ABC transporter [Asticcacaulis excentricus]